MVSVAGLKLMYLPFAEHFWIIFALSAATAPLLKAANSVLDGQCLFAFPDKGEFAKVRLWGSLGFGFLAVGTGYIVNHGSNKEDRYANIDNFFYTFAVISVTAVRGNHKIVSHMNEPVPVASIPIDIREIQK
jgi:hypothetical protein